jgi:FkbM family methyltransferase
VLDCGANVGSFARMAAPVVGPNGTIYCLEPIPDVCTALKLNIIKYKEWADQHKLKVASVEAICAGACRTSARWQRQKRLATAANSTISNEHCI